MRIKRIIFSVLVLFMVSLPFGLSLAEVYTSGFLQGLYGGGLDRGNPTTSDYTTSESRLQLRLESYSDATEFFGRVDFVYDDYNESSMDIELREGFAKFRMFNFLDFKIGRQIITWGTGDLIFINDVFAKDYQSFFIGRDDQYLKAPQNALRVELYTKPGNFAVVYTPRFTPNRIPAGRRLSYFNPLMGSIVGGFEPYFEGRMPESKFENGEIAARFSRYIGSADIALYAYTGFYKNPVGMDMSDSLAYYPDLDVYGASLRMPMFGGIAWTEGGYFYSRVDKDGDNPFVPNTKISSMIGFERQFGANFTANVQYQNEYMIDYDVYTSGLMPGMTAADEYYHLLTTRLTQRLKMETLTLSAFVFYSPNEEDMYGRFAVDYKYTDELTLTLGANIFEGNYDYTDFGTFKKNDNVYLKMTYGY